MRRLLGRAGDERGATAVELLAVMVIGGVVATMALNGIVGGMRTSIAAQARIEGLTDLQKGIERVSRELRTARPVCATSTSSTAVLVADRPTGRVRVTFAYVTSGATSSLRQTTEVLPANAADPCTAVATSSSATRIVDRVTAAPAFTWLDRAGGVVAPALAAQVGLVLTRPVDRAANPLTVQTRVAIRNRAV